MKLIKKLRDDARWKWRETYDRWVKNYEKYARMRGFTSFNDRLYHRRGFIDCWWQPGFHRFWQVWNPGISYFVYRLFIRLGGLKHWIAPTILAFALNGLAHTIVIWLLFGRWSYTLIVTFTCFGLLTV